MKQTNRMLEDANRYIAQNRHQTESRYRPRFHAVPPVGWANDPNGFFYDGEWYHLFYQHYPYEARWNDMHWGHWRSRDLAVWEDLPVAMAPDMPYDESGCFSGTALPDGMGGAHILYTGVSEKGGLQQQCLARFDGKTVRKAASNPVIPFLLLPEGYIRRDFRDPKLFKAPDGYRAVMAARHRDGGRLVCFSSPDLEHWDYKGVFCLTDGLMPECPDVFPLDGQTVVLYSEIPENPELPGNRKPVLYSAGHMDPGCACFEGGPWQRLDYGKEFYAAQTCEGAGGERIVISWMAAGEAKYPTAASAHGWSGMMTLPRTLRLEGGRIIQSPVQALSSLRKGKTHFRVELDDSLEVLPGAAARHAEIHFQADVSRAEAVALNVMEDRDERVTLLWRRDTLVLNRAGIACHQTGRFIPEISMPLRAHESRIEMTVYVDNCTIEVFAGGDAMSALAFPRGEAYGLSVFARGTAAAEIDCWKLA